MPTSGGSRAGHGPRQAGAAVVLIAVLLCAAHAAQAEAHPSDDPFHSTTGPPTAPARDTVVPFGSGGVPASRGFPITLAAAGAGSLASRRRVEPFVPFFTGAFIASAAFAALSRDPSAVCDGNATICYRDYCERAAAALRDQRDACIKGDAGFDPPGPAAPAAAGRPSNASTRRVAGPASMPRLVAAECPDPEFTECYLSKGGAFACLGRGRPTENSNVDLFCGADAGAPPPPPPVAAGAACQPRPGRLAAMAAAALAALLAALA